LRNAAKLTIKVFELTRTDIQVEDVGVYIALM